MIEEVNWDDPFSTDDPADRERAERRAEREARRTKRRGKLAERVREAQAESSPATAAAAAEPPPEATPPRQSSEAPAQAAPSTQSAGVIRRRRLAALLGLVVLAFVGLVIVVGANRLGGDDPAPAAPLKAQKTFDLTIPEGYRRDQIADIAKKAGVKGDYEAASKSVKGFDPSKYGAENPSSLEGFLFPATYNLFKKKAAAEDLVKDQLDAFKQNLKGVDLSYSKSRNLTTYDVLIIASMVQAEAANTKEMPQIAEVIYNRLSDDIPLGIDATIRYGLNNWTEPLTDSELATDSPYNTRLVAGLPPTPIGNPGLAAIEAAAKPAEGDLLYFVVKPGTCGHAFFETDAEFQDAVAEYNTAREAAGGKSPDAC